MRTDIPESGAIFSPCQTYRYSLWRIWHAEAPIVLFIGLNPSTADAQRNDPTIRRCIGFAKQWGYGGLFVANLFAWRSPQPMRLKQVDDPIGPETDDWLIKLNHEADLTIACWGNQGRFQHRNEAVTRLIQQFHCLRITQQGHPAHPLYLPRRLSPIVFSPPS